MVVRTSTIEPLESPISSSKYNAEINDIYEHLTRFDSFNTSDNAPDIPSIGTVWYDSSYDPPLAKRWNGSVWEWFGVYIYAPGDTFPPEGPSKGAVRVNTETGATEYWTGTLWLAVTIEGLGATFSGNGAYLWDREPRVPDGFNYPVIGCGFDIDSSAVQGASTGSPYRDIFVIGGNSKPFFECLVYSLNAGGTDWMTVPGLTAVANQLSIDPNLVVTVEKIIGFNGDFALPSGTTSSPFIFAIIRAGTGTQDGYHHVIGIRVTDDGANLAGTAVKGIIIPEALTLEPLAACIYNGKLRLGGKDVDGHATMWDISWTDTNFTLEQNPIPLTGYDGAITALADYYTLLQPTGFLEDGRNFGYIQALPAVGTGVGEVVNRVGFVQPDNRLAAVSASGKLYNGVGGSVAQLPTWAQVENFDGIEQNVIDLVVSAKRHTEILVGYVTLYGVQYGAIFERKMGSSDYQVVWQSDQEELACSIAYASIRNSYMTLTRDVTTGELIGIYDSDLRSVSDYFASINAQMQTLTAIVNKAMYRGGARKGEVRAWTKDPSLIPGGWALCDGSWNDEYGGLVPNMVGKFLRGAQYTPGSSLATGGNDSVTLITANLPSHTHGLSSHTHNITAVEHSHDMSHTHSYTGGNHYHGITGGTGSHYHSLSGVSVSISGWTSSDGSHTHTFMPGGNYYVPASSTSWAVVASGSTSAGAGFIKSTGAMASIVGVSSNGAHAHQISESVSLSGNTQSTSVGIPNATNDASPGIQITAKEGNTGGATGVGSLTSAPSTNTSAPTGSGTPISTVPSYITVYWIIATRDHAAAEGIDTSFLSVEQIQAILHATAPGPDNPFLTAGDVLALPPGSPGLSAYEMAVSDGFQGTVSQWLASLKGNPGRSAYDEAVLLGYTGTVSDWLASLNGVNGKSAYQVALDNGFTGTEAQWLASLKGTAGVNGTNGTDGADGQDGTDGDSAYAIAVANGFVGTEQDWLNSLVGPQGPTGATGAQGPVGSAGQDGEDGDVKILDNLGVLAAPPTDPGSEGDAYFVGATPPYDLYFWDVLSSAWVNGGPVTEGVKGDKGDPGTPGTPGAPGAPGVDGTDGAPGISAYQVAVNNGYVGSEAQWLVSLKGADGQDGTDGDDGAPGAPGVDGEDGESAYEVAVRDGFVGSEQDWLDSLEGATGPMGPMPTTPNTMIETPFAVISATGTVTPGGGGAANNPMPLTNEWMEYSFDEKEVGFWLDGSKIYKRTIPWNNPASIPGNSWQLAMRQSAIPDLDLTSIAIVKTETKVLESIMGSVNYLGSFELSINSDATGAVLNYRSLMPLAIAMNTARITLYYRKKPLP